MMAFFSILVHTQNHYQIFYVGTVWIHLSIDYKVDSNFKYLYFEPYNALQNEGKCAFKIGS